MTTSTPLINASRAYKVIVFVDGKPYTNVLFLDESMAQAFADSIRNDDSLAGISDAYVLAVAANDAAVDEFWKELNDEA